MRQECRVAFEEITEEQFDHVFRTGAKAVLWAMQAAFPHLRERGGRIINLVSLAAERGDPGLAPYNATKLAIQRAMKGEPKIDEILARKGEKHPFSPK